MPKNSPLCPWGLPHKLYCHNQTTNHLDYLLLKQPEEYGSETVLTVGCLVLCLLACSIYQCECVFYNLLVLLTLTEKFSGFQIMVQIGHH